MEIPEKIQELIIIAGIVLVIIGPILTISRFTEYQGKAEMGLIFSTVAWLENNNLWMATLYLLVTTTFGTIYGGIALPIIGFAVILFVKIINLISGERELSLKEVLAWAGLILALIGPIITLSGFEANHQMIELAGWAGVIGPATGEPIGYLGFPLYLGAPDIGFWTGIILIFISFGLLVAAKVIDWIKD